MTRVRSTLAVLVLALFLGGGAGCEAGTTGGETSNGVAVGGGAAGGRYMLAFDIDDASGAFVTTANGFPLRRDDVMARSTDDELSLDLTPALVSGRNTASVRVVPILSRAGQRGDSLVAAPVRFSLGVFREGGAWLDGASVSADETAALFERYLSGLRSRWARWTASEDSVFAADPSVRARYEAALDEVDRAYGWGPALDSARAWVVSHPFEVETEFVRTAEDGAPSFDAVLREAPVVAGTPADSARLRAYAVRLRDLTADRDTAALWAAFEGKYADEFAWWGGAAVIGEDSAAFLAGARSRIVMRGAAPFEDSDVRLRSWSGGRVWELYRDDADGLFQRAEGGPYREVYVGEGPDGRLRVVR